jgi:hypothetical protein
MQEAVNAVCQTGTWSRFFEHFAFPWEFFDVKEYRSLLIQTGFEPLRLELKPRDLVHYDKSGLAGWFRTTWIPYTHRVPQEWRENFIEEVLERYLQVNPTSPDGHTCVPMVRLEVEALRP